MARPAKGSVEARGNGFRASIPGPAGTRDRITHTFTHRGNAERWIADALEARRDGRPIPDPVAYEGLLRAPTLRPVKKAVRDPVPFSKVALDWWHENYVLAERAGVQRSTAVEDVIRRRLGPFFDELGDIGAVTRNDILAFVRVLSGRDDQRATAEASVGLATAELLSMREASKRLDVEVATVRRYWLDGRFPNAFKEPGRGETVRIPIGDVIAFAATRSGRTRALAKSSVNEILRVVNAVFIYAQSEGIVTVNPAAGVKALAPIPSRTRRPPEQADPEALDLAACSRIVARLAPHHQSAFWLQRIAGLRISEVFGLHVDDVVDMDDGGLLFVRRQGGKTFWIRDDDGKPVRVTEKETLKTSASRRVIAIPTQLVDLLRLLVEAYHTGDGGEILDPTARLIPDLTGRRTGQASYTTALQNTLRREGFAFENVGYHVSSHSLRKSLSSELRWTLQIDEMVRSRLLGHRLQAFDGGSPTTARNYTQRMPQLGPLTAVAAALDATIVEEIGTLLVPTTSFNRIRWTGEMLERGDLVEGRLREAGWLTREAAGLTVVDAAAALGVSRITLNRWLNEGRIEGELTATPGRHNAWRVSSEEVERLRLRQETRVSVANAAAELGCGNQELWRRIRRGEIEAEQDLRSGDWSVSRETLEGLREEYESRRRLYERAVPIAQAAVRLGVSITVVAYRINNGRLAVDPERDGNRRMVTLASIERELAAQAKPPTMRGRATEGADIVFAAEITRETGITRLEILALCRSGVLVRRDRHYQLGIERESYETWLRVEQNR